MAKKRIKKENDNWWTGKTGSGKYYIPQLDKKLREKRPHSSPEGRDFDVQKILKEKKKVGGPKAPSPPPRRPTRPGLSSPEQRRTKKGHGGSAAQQHYLKYGYGPTKTKLISGKPKLAKKGW